MILFYLALFNYFLLENYKLTSLKYLIISNSESFYLVFSKDLPLISLYFLIISIKEYPNISTLFYFTFKTKSPFCFYQK